jgi:glutathione peroxidase
MVIAVPSNDFGKKEPGSVADIDRVVHGQYGVTFPVTAKTLVRGPGAHPFYRWVVAERPQDPPMWNFQKYLISREGYIDAAFSPEIEPTSGTVQAAIDRALAAS